MLNHSLLCFSVIVCASGCVRHQYDLQMRLLSEGKEISAPRVVVREGEKASIIEETRDKKTKIDVGAKEMNNVITLDVNYQTTVVQSEGTQSRNASFLVSVKENEKAQIYFDHMAPGSAPSGTIFEITAQRKPGTDLAKSDSTPAFRKLVRLSEIKLFAHRTLP